MPMDELRKEDLLQAFQGMDFPVEPQVFSELPSTNTELYRMGQAGAPEGTLILASAQSAGIGRMGRSFFSPGDTGLYMSLLLRPREAADVALRLTTAAASAVCETLRDWGMPAQIKWVNDIFLDQRKVCGILAQAAWTKEMTLDFVVVGIGINVYPPEDGFPEELSGIAGALDLPRKQGTRVKLAADIVTRLIGYYQELSTGSYMDSYRRYSMLPGKALIVHKGEERIPALCLGIDDDCHLLVRYEDGTEVALDSGEVSVRLEL